MPPEPPMDSFFENTVIAFEQCLFDKIHALIPATPPLTTFSPSKSRSIVFNAQNRCWCPTTLSDENLHSKYNCPNRPFWKLAKNYKFNPCRHTPLYTSRCPTCIDISGLARDFVRYAAHQDFASDPPDPDADMREIEMFVLHYHGVGDTANVSPAALAEYTRQTKMLAYLVYLARSIEVCRFAAHIEPARDHCLVHGILRWDEEEFTTAARSLMRRLIRRRQRRS